MKTLSARLACSRDASLPMTKIKPASSTSKRAKRCVSTKKASRDAQRALEESSIDELLGQGGGSEYVGPKAPKLRPVGRSMDVPDFTLAAFEMEGARVAEKGDGVYLVQSKEGNDRIRFEAKPDNLRPLVLYEASAPPFQRLVKRTIGSGVHNVNDADPDPRAECEKLAAQWAERVGATLKETKASAVTAAFTGNALLRVRATVAHDSYEQLISCCCEGDDHQQTSKGDAGLSPVERIVRDPATLGINTVKLSEAGARDEAIAEFCRFYEERREEEMEAAGSDARKRQKLNDDFTPRLDMSLVGLEARYAATSPFMYVTVSQAVAITKVRLLCGLDRKKFCRVREPISAFAPATKCRPNASVNVWSPAPRCSSICWSNLSSAIGAPNLNSLSGAN